uniref:Methylthioribose-1-phosphate isomerase n=1 Tax=Lygus hesperus TaxID=30085 RepID=A0A0A9YJW2_LYGHE
MIIPSYKLIDNIQYAVQRNVEIITENIIHIETTKIQDEEDNTSNNKKVIESNIEYVLQKVHETIDGQISRNQGEVTDEDHATSKITSKTITSKTTKVSTPKQWLMDVIPTVIKTSTKTAASRQNSATLKLQHGGRPNVTPNPEDVKPVFKFLKKQREMEYNDEK